MKGAVRQVLATLRPCTISLPDAYRLATTRSADASLASLDEKLLRAAKDEGIPTAEAATRRRQR